MTLSKKLRYALIDLGAKLVSEQDMLNMILEEADIDIGDLVANGLTPRKFWKGTIDNLDHDQLERFLSVLHKKYYPKNKELKELIGHIAQVNIVKLMSHLVDIIQAKSCVLFLGPQFLNCLEEGKQVPFTTYFSAQLAAKLKTDHIFYDEDQSENLSYIIDRHASMENYAEIDTKNEALEIYNEGHKPDFFHRKVFELKFPLIINTNPDLIIPDLFPGATVFSYYDITKDAVIDLPEVEPGNVLVYNIFGAFRAPESVLFTEKEAVKFTKKVYSGAPPIPLKIATMIMDRYGIFLGFDFTEWHFKILFDILDLKNKPGNYCFTETDMDVAETNQEYYERHYNMRFIKNNIRKMFIQIQEQAYGNGAH